MKFQLKKKLPNKYKKFFWASLAVLGIKPLYWHLKRNKNKTEIILGYKNCRKYFGISSSYHKKILKEKDYKERALLYHELYDKLFAFLKIHVPELEIFGFNPDLIESNSNLFENKVVLDYGCGYGVSTDLISKKAHFVYGIDASQVVIEEANRKYAKLLANVELRCHSIPKLPFESEMFDTVYSNDLLEHMHPEDLNIHLTEIYRILKSDGKYLFWTPGRRLGPWDCTQFFYPRGMGFKSRGVHIREYTYGELIAIIQEIGFRKIELPDIKKEVLMIVSK